MDLGSPSFWINFLSFLVINVALVALVVLAVAGFVTHREGTARLTSLRRARPEAGAERPTREETGIPV